MSINSINRETDAFINDRGAFRRKFDDLHSNAVNGNVGTPDGEKWVRESDGEFRSVDSLKPRTEDLDNLHDKTYVTGYNEGVKVAEKSAANVSVLKLAGSAGAGLLTGVGAMALYNQFSSPTTSQRNGMIS